jgi:hypothetical protein
MNPHGNHSDTIPAGVETRFVWLVAFVASSLVIVAAALALDLHNQKRRLENVNAELKETLALREMESKSASAEYATGEAALQRVRELGSEEEADLKKLGEVYAQREPAVKQSVEMQDKFMALVKDLLDLAKFDRDAKEIVSKYNVQQ